MRENEIYIKTKLKSSNIRQDQLRQSSDHPHKNVFKYDIIIKQYQLISLYLHIDM